MFPVLAPLDPSLAGQALAFLVFVRNFGSILGITIGASVVFLSLSIKPLWKFPVWDARLYGAHKRAGQEAA